MRRRVHVAAPCAGRVPRTSTDQPRPPPPGERRAPGRSCVIARLTATACCRFRGEDVDSTFEWLARHGPFPKTNITVHEPGSLEPTTTAHVLGELDRASLLANWPWRGILPIITPHARLGGPGQGQGLARRGPRSSELRVCCAAVGMHTMSLVPCAARQPCRTAPAKRNIPPPTAIHRAV